MNTAKGMYVDGNPVYFKDDNVRNFISDEYSEDKTYAVGDYCINDNKLYMCTAPTSGGFDGSCWKQTNMSAEVSEQNKNLNVRYNAETDMFQVLVNGTWVDAIKAYGQSQNWIPNGCKDQTNTFGVVSFLKGNNGIDNSATYLSDGYVLLSYNGVTNGANASMWTSKKIPLGLFKSVTLRFRQEGATSGYQTQIRLDETHAFSGKNQIILWQANTLGDTGIIEVTLDLSSYNASGLERYLGITVLGVVYIYDITFNK